MQAWLGTLAVVLAVNPIAGKADRDFDRDPGDVPPVKAVTEAVTVHIPPAGLEYFAGQVPALVPPTQDVDDQYGVAQGCIIDQVEWWLGNAVGLINVDTAELVPSPGNLTLELDAQFAMDANIQTWGCFFNNYCDVWLDWSPLDISAHISLEVAPDPITGRNRIQAEVTGVDVTTSLQNPNVSGCSGASTIENNMADQVPTIEAELIDTVQESVPAMIDEMINGATGLDLAGELALGETPLAYDLFPTALDLEADGVTLVLGGSVAATSVAPCIEGNPVLIETPNPLPEFGPLTPGGATYQLTGGLSDDLINQALIGAWQSGLLCMDITEQNGEPMTSDQLALLGGDVQRITTDGGAMAIEIYGPTPPQLVFAPGAPPSAGLNVPDIGVNVFADVHGRMARLAEVEVDAQAAVDIELVDGQIITTAEFVAEKIEATLGYHELIPESGPMLVELMPTLFSSFAPSLDDLVPPIEIPAQLAGINLTPLELSVAGEGNDFAALFLALDGDVDLDAAGCGAGAPGGCGADGCTLNGPGDARARSLLGVLGFVAIGIWLRRRRRE